MAKKMSMKKKFFLGWIALEIAGLALGLPAGAQIVDRVMFSAAPRAAHVVTPLAPGMTEIMVASNAPFVIISEGAIGEMQMRLSVTGQVNGNSFGARAQNPGEIPQCVFSSSAAPTTLYTASRRTAAKRGDIIGQAVMIHVKYDPSLHPRFLVKTLNQPEAETAAKALACTGVSS